MFAILLSLNSPSIIASVLDTDYYCRVYGCVMVGDGSNYDFYDVYNFLTGGTVPVGGQLIPYNSATGGVLITGTLTPPVAPGAGQGMLLGVDQNSDDTADIIMLDNNSSGFLDLGDGIAPFTLTPFTDVVLKDRAFEHSIYIASRTDFELFGQASLISQTMNLAAQITPDQTDFQIKMVQQGIDAGLSFGGSTANPNFLATPAITNLNDLWGIPTQLAVFRRANGTRRGNAPNLADQSVRVDFEYQPPIPDFSFGVGELDYQVIYTFYNR